MSFPKFPIRRKHCWFSGRILACHAGDRGSIPRQCTFYINVKKAYFLFYIVKNVGKACISGRFFVEITIFGKNGMKKCCKTLTAVGFEPTPPK